MARTHVRDDGAPHGHVTPDRGSILRPGNGPDRPSAILTDAVVYLLATPLGDRSEDVLYSRPDPGKYAGSALVLNVDAVITSPL